VPENNLGQLSTLLRSQFLVDARPLSKVQGRPFLIREIRNAIEDALKS
jgi:2-oxoglutarate ferredoxin oxidoreductase subunit alpha